MSNILDYIKDIFGLNAASNCTENERAVNKCDTCINEYKIFKCYYCRYKEYIGFNPDNQNIRDVGGCRGWRKK